MSLPLFWAGTLAGTFVAYRLLGYLIHRWAVGHFTVLNELKTLGVDSKAGRRLKGTAVICGGSIAGLLAARICSDHFKEVVIIDPDNDELVARACASLPETPGGKCDPEIGHHPRPRVAQSRVFHATQVLNLWALERLFPNFRQWVKTVGSGVGAQIRPTYSSGVVTPYPIEYYPRGPPETFNLSRGAYETLLRFLVTRVPNVRFVKGTVSGVTVSSEDPKKLDGVAYRIGQDTKETKEEKAELVIDCSGPSVGGVSWLKRAGFSVPAKESYNPYMRYWTVEYPIDPTVIKKLAPENFDKTTKWLIFCFPDFEKDHRILMIQQVENNRLWVSVGGWAYEGEARTVAQIREEVKSFRQEVSPPDWLWELFDYLESGPEKDASGTAVAAGPLHFIKYHNNKLNLPNNFVAIGDAVMKLNPVFAQGMTKAMIGAIMLDAQLRRETGNHLSSSFAHQFFAMQSQKIADFWDSDKAVDYLLPTTKLAEGDTRSTGALLRWFFTKMDLLQIDGNREVTYAQNQVLEYIAPPTLLFTPTLLLGVAWKGVRDLLKSAPNKQPSL